MNTSPDQSSRYESTVRMLDELVELAEGSSLTGALTSGAARAVRRYNAVVAQLEGEGAIAKGVFEQLPENADFGELGVECRLLRSQLVTGRSRRHTGHSSPDESMIVRLAPFVESSDLRDLVRAHMLGHRRLDPEVITQLAPFLERETLSEMVRNYLDKEAPEAPVPTAVAPVPTDQRLTRVEDDRVPTSEDLSVRLQRLAEQLQASDLSPDRRAELAIELAKLGQEQALLARSEER